jgi:hypothetical protein
MYLTVNHSQSSVNYVLVQCILRRAIFPKEIFTTNQRPDIVTWSKISKQVIIIELTVPWEERIEEAHERKRLKYEELIAQCRERKWKNWSMPVEVGCRGFAGQSLWNMAKMLGMRDKKSM